jgi:hypothetical protein
VVTYPSILPDFEMKPAANTRTPKPTRRKPAVGALAVEGHAPAFREIIGRGVRAEGTTGN